MINEYAKDDMINNLSILVTGASFGFGIETSRVLAYNGAKVFMMGAASTNQWFRSKCHL